jgi:hypothetical protein
MIWLEIAYQYVLAHVGGTYGLPSGPITMPFGSGAEGDCSEDSSRCSTGPGILLSFT